MDLSVEGAILRLGGFTALMGGWLVGYPAPMGMLLWALFAIAGNLADANKIRRAHYLLLLERINEK